MVRTTTEADDESTTTESYDAPEDVTVGDVIDVGGASFLPKSNLEVVSVDPDWAADRYPDARVFAAKIPNRSNAREYTFKVSEYGTVTTTNSNGTFGLGVTVDVVDAADPDEPQAGDTVFIRTDDGVIEATVEDAQFDTDRPEDGARMGGKGVDTDDPSVHYVDYYHADDE